MTPAGRAAIVSCALLVASVAVTRASRVEPTPIRAPLSDLPLSMGRWTGQVEPPLAQRILDVLKADDYTVRTYRTADGRVANLYIGYYDSQRQGDTMHSPLNCLPGAGWTPMSITRIPLTVPTAAGRPTGTRAVVVNRVVIERGLNRQLVLYWYQSHGRVIASEYWGKIYTVLDAIRLNRTDGALVRVIVPISGGDDAGAQRTASSFVESLFPLLHRHLPS